MELICYDCTFFKKLSEEKKEKDIPMESKYEKEEKEEKPKKKKPIKAHIYNCY